MKLTKSQIKATARRVREASRKFDQPYAAFVGPKGVRLSAEGSDRYQHNRQRYPLVGFYDGEINAAMLAEDLEYIGVEIA